MASGDVITHGVGVAVIHGLEGSGEEDTDMSCGEFCAGIKEGMSSKSGADWARTLGRILALLTTLYFFLFSLDLMGSSFKVLGGCTAGGMFDSVTNPIAGLMIGVLATVLVQSSSTSTAIVVSLVGANSMSVSQAIPVIMGANIGTSVTNTIVSVGQIGNPDEFERAFAGATVHDMFNFLSVAVLLPLEIITGVLERLTTALIPSKEDMGEKGDKWVGPLKIIVSPLVNLVLKVDKKVIEKVALGDATCEETYAKVAAGKGADICEAATGMIKCDCSKAGELISCPLFFKEQATEDDDLAAGGVCLFISLVLLCTMLIIMVKLLQSMVLGSSSKMLRKATALNPLVAMVVGAAITILVQSSSVTTSVLTPLVGVGVIPLEKMLPLTLGANIGTTATALLASLVSSNPKSVQIALCHLFFNIFGIIIWYPLPFMRAVPLNGARALGAATRRVRSAPLWYILFAFVFAPGLLLGLSSLFEFGAAYTVLGTIFTVGAVFGFVYAIYWWNKKNGRETTYQMFEARQERSDLVKNLPEVVADLRSQIAALEEKVGGGKGASCATHNTAKDASV